ncbi:hypothetical protein BKA62DRAFT_699919 [Auriculariales sp. MPI-PUGE-AT-0066]|nr:hypothetical protein BKA62DRAFT_699919 [Auriculariales sp. MPI-PUGE-AT-0066]
MPPSPLYSRLLDISHKHAKPANLDEILAIRAPDAVHAWGHTFLVSRNPKLGERMNNAAFEAHLRSTGPYLESARPVTVHSIAVDEHQRTSSVHMSYFLRPAGSEEVVEQELVWTLKFTEDDDVQKVLIRESVEFIDAAASSRLGEIIRGIHGNSASHIKTVASIP